MAKSRAAQAARVNASLIMEVTQDFAPQAGQDQCVGARCGDLVQVISRASPEWYTVITPGGMQGYFPSQYLKTHIAPTEQMPLMAAHYDYTPQGKDQIDLIAGERVKVLDKESDDWWLVQTIGTRDMKGYVPASYLGSTIEVDTCQLPYFCGQAMDDDIARNLNQMKAGAYLVRETSKGELFLVVKLRKGIQQVAILPQINDKFILRGDAMQRDSVEELLSHYYGHEVKAGWGKLKQPCVFRMESSVPLPPEVDMQIKHIEWCMETLMTKASDGMLSPKQRSDMSMLSLARSDLRHQKLLTAELAHFIEYYDPVRQVLREPMKVAKADGSGTATATMAAQPQRAQAARTAPPPPQRSTSISSSSASKRPGRQAPAPPRRQSSLSAQDKAAAQTAARRSSQAAAGDSRRGSAAPSQGTSIKSSSGIGPAAKARHQQQQDTLHLQQHQQQQHHQQLQQQQQEQAIAIATHVAPPPPTASTAQAASISAVNNLSAHQATSSPTQPPAQLAAQQQPAQPQAEARPAGSGSTAATGAKPPPTASGALGTTRRSPRTEHKVLRNTGGRTSPQSSGTDDGYGFEQLLNQVGDDVIQFVRDQTNISFKDSKNAVGTILFLLMDRAKDPTSLGRAMASALALQDDELKEGGEDSDRIVELLEAVTAITTDSEQRNWSVGDDSASIATILEELEHVVKNANPAVVKQIVRKWCSPGQTGEYEIADTLVRYYQMETRNELRLAIIRVLGELVIQDLDMIESIKVSVLPVEIAKSIMRDPWDEAVSSLNYYSMLLETMIYADGRPIAYQHYEYLNADFIIHLLSMVEHKPETKSQLKITEQAFALLLAFNRHFALDDLDANIVMQALLSRPCKALGERLVECFNRQADPVAASIGLPAPETFSPQQHSIMKFFMDVFSNAKTGHPLLYEGDCNVLIEVLLREMGERATDNPVQVDLIDLLARVVRNSVYADGRLYDEPINKTLTAISDESIEEETDQTAKARSAAKEALKMIFA
eukprot:TRINITY_DN10690_c0_g2_i5.p1 TRINITY_DN10690_c0_g2~~TRINITY_DN10690_c0_g2_i5.p1  ORF type:complete len:1024 (+),score=262.72 TRINITY_DN10690_c0_g2_i5:69-3074(+)